MDFFKTVGEPSRTAYSRSGNSLATQRALQALGLKPLAFGEERKGGEM
jgi:hypothetical protein